MWCSPWRHCVNHWVDVPHHDWHSFQLQTNGQNFFVFFAASRSHFYIQPEGLWQIMCQGFMMWDVIGPPSWWSKWMCISQWHPHICLAADEHASHGMSHTVTDLIHCATFVYSCSAWPKHHFQQIVPHRYRVTAFPLNITLIEERHNATCVYFPDKCSN